ncbi:unnamed protein product [Arabidopsis thaliana]|uniref:Uncharacterized protein n=1 Tax=Arabidopsis thaliana TaxID=3702 RepID=A0A5S9XDB7_ARATH|nr:unnamed protein product [Arabidopsis thaliana]
MKTLFMQFALEETGDNWEGKCIAEKQTERLELKLSNAEANQIDEKKKKKRLCIEKETLWLVILKGNLSLKKTGTKESF